MIQDIINNFLTKDIVNNSAYVFAAIVAVFFIVASWAFIHHWGSYGISKRETKLLYIFYFSVSIFLFAVMGVSLLLFIK
ncbi:MAG: hypothetical protein WD712_01950 [Candidatus Spechtbacterales bacterium]